MKNFKFDSIRYQNLLAVGSTPIEIDLNSHHKTLITGINGGGKSTMIEAITYALFGKPFRNIKLAQLINSVNKKELLVELNMTYDNSTYLIRRGQKPAIFEVFKNGLPLDAVASSKDFQAQFEEMIGMNYASYKQVVVLGTAGFTPFMNLGKAERRKLVEDLLEVSVLAKMDKANKDEIKEINAQLAQIELKISHCNTQIDTLTKADERQQKLAGDNLIRLQDMRTEAQKVVEQSKAKHLDLTEKLTSIELPTSVSTEIMGNQSEQGGKNTTKLTVERVIALYEKGGKCPTCLQELEDQSLVEKLEKNRDKLTKDLATLSEQLKDLQEKQLEFEATKRSMMAIESDIRANTAASEQAIDRVKKLDLALAEAQKEFVDNSVEIAGLKEALVGHVTLKSDMVVEKHRRSLITEMLKDSGIKGAIIQKYLPFFNRQINHYLSLLEADYSFTLDEEFNETIKSRGRESFSYASFSQGEKGRIDLAIMFTWRDVAEKISGIKISCLILDEVFDSALDTAGSKHITTILNTMQDTNVFIISHRDHNPQDYGQHIQMKKVGRFTVME